MGQSLLTAAEAAKVASVTVGTIKKWGDKGLVARIPGTTPAKYCYHSLIDYVFPPAPTPIDGMPLVTPEEIELLRSTHCPKRQRMLTDPKSTVLRSRIINQIADRYFGPRWKTEWCWNHVIDALDQQHPGWRGYQVDRRFAA